jgi:hypothetical protein
MTMDSTATLVAAAAPPDPAAAARVPYGTCIVVGLVEPVPRQRRGVLAATGEADTGPESATA